MSNTTSTLTRVLYMVGPRVAYFGEKTPESSDPTYKAINKMIATKRCAYGILLDTIPDTSQFWKRNSNDDPVRLFHCSGLCLNEG